MLQLPRHRTLAPLLAVGLTALVPAAAQAASVATSDGQTIRVTEAAPGQPNHVTIGIQDAGVVEVSDEGVTAGPGCAPKVTEPTVAVCPLGAGGVVVETGGGDDSVGTFFLTGVEALPDGALRVDLGDGNDRFLPGERGEVVSGGAGNDTLPGGGGNDVLDGGPGNDTVEGNTGADTLRGGDGDDQIKADDYSDSGVFGDLIDGGAGNDTLDDYRQTGGDDTAPAISVTLDGAANDGRPGEGDNVAGVEQILSGSAGTFVGDDGANVFVAPETGLAGSYSGQGGADRLLAGDASGDRVDGGTGDDDLSGGYGDDTLTGGAGRDVIAGDRPARCNEWHCDLGGGFGNDTIEARDGEVDSISCGPGTDLVRADAADVVAPDCETVERAAAGGGGGGAKQGGGAPRGGVAGKLTVSVGSVKDLKKLLRGGLTVKVTGAKAGATVKASLVVKQGTARKLRLTTSRRRAVTIASGSAKARAGAATTTVKVHFTKAARKRLARKRGVTVSLRVSGASSRTVKLGR